MKKFVIANLFLLSVSTALSAATICPSTINTNSDCGYILTLGPGGTITGAPVLGANPYDGGDDALVGVINNSLSAFSGSITLTGSGNGGGIFAFDNDGICTYTSTNSVSLSYCASLAPGDPRDYQGPLSTFSGINAAGTSGTVRIVGLAAGATTFFSLEGAPNSLVISPPPPPVPDAPEPASIILTSGAVAGLLTIKLKRRSLPTHF